MKALLGLLGLVDRLLQLLVPPIPNRICYASVPDYTDNAFYVFRHALRTRNDLQHTWLLQDDALRGRIAREFAETVRAAGTRGHVLRLERRTTLGGYFACLRSRFTFHTHGLYRFRRWSHRRTIVCLWHGMPLKRIGLLNPSAPAAPGFGDLHIATSALFQDLMARSFGVDAGAVKRCSQPRCDPLQFPDCAQVAPAMVRERLGIGPGPLVVWLPSHRTEREGEPARTSFLNTLPAGLPQVVADAARRNGAAVLVKLHPWDALNESAPDWSWPELRLLREADWAATGIQLYDLLAACDGVISDFSSVLVDTLVAGKPAGILGFDGAGGRGLNFTVDQIVEFTHGEKLTPETLDGFLRRCAGRSAPRPSPFYDRFALPGSEQVLREAGI